MSESGCVERPDSPLTGLDVPLLFRQRFLEATILVFNDFIQHLGRHNHCDGTGAGTSQCVDRLPSFYVRGSARSQAACCCARELLAMTFGDAFSTLGALDLSLLR